jgi:hypothetical protein
MDPLPFLSDVIKAGVSRLLHLMVRYHSGLLGVIVENIPIRLISFRYHICIEEEDLEEHLDQINQIARCHPTLESLVVDCETIQQLSPTRILPAVKQFEGLKRLEMEGCWLWTEADVEVISKLPLLESLKFGGFWSAEIIRPLINCKSLTILILSAKRGSRGPFYLFSLLRGIGLQLRSLTILSRISHELIMQIPESCPNESLLVVYGVESCWRSDFDRR